VTVVVIVPGQDEPWQVSNAGFRLLVEEVRQLEPAAEDLQVILQAQAMQALDLAATASRDRQRVAALLAGSARRLRGSLLERVDRDTWESEFAEALAVLEC
jgi:hypothetical protein